MKNVAIVRNVALGLLTRELHLDAMVDTGATWCVVPPSIARTLGFNTDNRIAAEKVNVVGGQIMMDLHRLEYLKVGSAKAHLVTFGVCNMGPSRLMLVGLSFIRQFMTTFDFQNNRILFRSRKSLGTPESRML